MNIFILHPGKANYPEIAAYRNFFSKEFTVTDGTIQQFDAVGNKQDTIVWCIMGFFPKKLTARLIIHDYRSLSVGYFPKTKDLIKKYLNIKPDIRIFQNKRMEQAMGFQDNVRSLTLPMGVPDWIFNLEADSSLPGGTYCYIGEITRERGMDKVINAFKKYRSNEKETLILVGPAEESIKKKFSNQLNIIFTGKLSQLDALKVVKNSSFCISRIPHKYPYCYQAPTKLLEYSALQKNILCNNALSNTETARLLNIDIIICPDEIFTAIAPSAPQSKTQLGTSIDWNNVIQNSEIYETIRSKL
ncbi:glycosyltransferase [Pseudomonas sp. TNT3]|uniref:glycosyltransferase n=1 Tax=Pseudomonas sp. TNT3 TaxID=2654097 RepID=UPI001391CAC9|nr:glycosyltransferase [Pseudomonas sp. TNT3]KAI2689529.1 hypothetical protein GBC55_010725 [Pseudomonas sp. TNT3]